MLAIKNIYRNIINLMAWLRPKNNNRTDIVLNFYNKIFYHSRENKLVSKA